MSLRRAQTAEATDWTEQTAFELDDAQARSFAILESPACSDLLSGTRTRPEVLTRIRAST
jgi:hypothetical protein